MKMEPTKRWLKENAAMMVNIGKLVGLIVVAVLAFTSLQTTQAQHEKRLEKLENTLHTHEIDQGSMRELLARIEERVKAVQDDLRAYRRATTRPTNP